MDTKLFVDIMNSFITWMFFPYSFKAGGENRVNGNNANIRFVIIFFLFDLCEYLVVFS